VYRILTLDGGGIRGIFTTTILERLHEAVPGYLGKVDLVAGTSTGAIIACGLAAGMHPTDLSEIYRTQGPLIFDDSWLDDLKDLGGLTGAEYGNSHLRDILTSVFERGLGLRTLDDLGRRVLIPTFDLDDGDDPRRPPGKLRSWKPKFFHNFPGPDSDGAERIVDVLMRACAGPVYFPTVDGYIDGGVVANNPAMVALAQALHPGTGGRRLEEITLLSIGTGQSATFIPGDHLDWGTVRWASPIVRVCIDAQMDVARYECEQLLGARFHRVEQLFEWGMRLDDWQKVPDLRVLAEEVDLEPTITWLRTVAGARRATA
jgi:patatin-like phospholipase/acyl hydrolase